MYYKHARKAGDIYMLSRELGESHEQLLVDPKYRQIVERIARKYAQSNLIDWQDAAQTAHIKVLQGLKTGKFSQRGLQEFYPWAATVARNAVIDFVRREKQRNHQSLNKIVIGTDVSLLDTIADEFDLWDTVERANLIIKARQIIKKLALSYPKREYVKLWQGLIQGKNQTQLALELGVTQSQISRRRQELLKHLAQGLELLEPEAIKQEQHKTRKSKVARQRSQTEW